MTIRFLGIGKFQIVYVHVRVQCCVSSLTSAVNVCKTKTFYMLSDFHTARMTQPTTRGGEEQPPVITEGSSIVTGEITSPSPVIIPTPPPGFTEPGPPGSFLRRDRMRAAQHPCRRSILSRALHSHHPRGLEQSPLRQPFPFRGRPASRRRGLAAP